MGSRKMLLTTAMVALLALPLAACTGSTYRLKAENMCKAAGGTYSGNTCNPGTPNQKTAKQMCDAHGGVYISDLDQCEIAGASK